MSSVIPIILPVFGLILVGYLCRRFGIMSSHAASELNRFVVWLCLPALLFTTTATASWQAVWHPQFIAVCSLATLLIFMTTLLYRWRRHRVFADASIDGLSAAYANTGYIGIPLCLMVFGDDGLQPALIATLIVVCILFAIALTCLEVGLQSRGRYADVLVKVIVALAKNPLVISPLLGTAWNLTGLGLAEPLRLFLDPLGDATAPCALVSIGLFLAGSSKTPSRDALVLVLMKLIAHPLLTWLLAYYVFSLPALWAKSAVLLSALPTGTGPFMLAEFYRREAALVSRTILLSTLGSLITLTVCLSWLMQSQ